MFILFLRNSIKKPLFTFLSSATRKSVHGKSIKGYFHIQIRLKQIFKLAAIQQIDHFHQISDVSERQFQQEFYLFT